MKHKRLERRQIGLAANCTGYGLIAVVWLILGSMVTGWAIPGTSSIIYSGTLFLLFAALIASMGLLVLAGYGKIIDAFSLLGMAGVLICLYLGHLVGQNNMKALQTDFHWFALAWTSFFSVLWLFSIRSEPVCKSLLLMFFALGCLCSAVGEWMTWSDLTWLGGITFLICSLLSAITALTEGLKGFKGKKAARASSSKANEQKRLVIHA